MMEVENGMVSSLRYDMLQEATNKQISKEYEFTEHEPTYEAQISRLEAIPQLAWLIRAGGWKDLSDMADELSGAIEDKDIEWLEMVADELEANNEK